MSDMLVNLSLLLLSKIVNELDDNIDRVCFSLVCKRWYNDRNKYLTFNTKTITLQLNNEYPDFYLDSYKDILDLSLSKKSCKLIIKSVDDEFDPEEAILYDYLLPNEIVADFESIPSNVGTIVVRDSIESDDFDRLVADTSLTKIKYCPFLSESFPSTLTSLSFNCDFNLPIVSGGPISRLENLTALCFKYEFNQQLEIGSLPESLTSLKLGPGYIKRIECGVLPPNLKHLQMVCEDESSIVDGSLPDSLESLNISTNVGNWLRLAKVNELPNIKSLMIENSAMPLAAIGGGVLPKTLTKLSMKKFQLFGPVIPQSVEYLHLPECLYEYSNLFPAGGASYHFKELTLGNVELTSTSLSNIKVDKLNLSFYYSPLDNAVLNVESIKFGLTNTGLVIPNGSNWSSVKDLSLPNMYRNKLEVGTIPNSVETLNLANYTAKFREKMADGVIPPSVKVLSMDTIEDGFQSIPPALQHINFTMSQTIFGTVSVVCKVRKLDDEYYLIFGRPENYGLISSFVHKSLFLKPFFSNLKTEDGNYMDIVNIINE